MNNHGTAYLVIRSIVRTLVALLFVFAVIIGIPVAAQLVWPALVISAILFLVVWLLHRRDQKRIATDAS